MFTSREKLYWPLKSRLSVAEAERVIIQVRTLKSMKKRRCTSRKRRKRRRKEKKGKTRRRERSCGSRNRRWSTKG
jgi:hypothetical protein